MGQLTFTTEEVEHMIARCMTPFRQDVVGDNSISISANTETRYAVDGDARNEAQAPPYMTDRWDTSNNIMTAVTEHDGPVYVADVSFTWTPSASSEGIARIRVYVNDTTPKLIKTYPVHYKGEAAEPMSVLTAWYWGDEAGYDAKNDGIYFTVEFEHAGTITAPSLLIYNTQ